MANLTARDLELASIVWGCFETEPKVDMVKFMKAAGFSTLGSARACWGSVKKKLIANANACAKDADGTSDNAAASTPKAKGSAKKTAKASTGSKRKAKSSAVMAADDDDEQLDAIETPSKKVKTEKVKEEPKEEPKEEEGEEINNDFVEI